MEGVVAAHTGALLGDLANTASWVEVSLPCVLFRHGHLGADEGLAIGSFTAPTTSVWLMRKCRRIV